MTPPSRSHHRLTPADPIAAFAHVRFDAPRAYADLDLALALAWQVIEDNALRRPLSLPGLKIGVSRGEHDESLCDVAGSIRHRYRRTTWLFVARP